MGRPRGPRPLRGAGWAGAADYRWLERVGPLSPQRWPRAGVPSSLCGEPLPSSARGRGGARVAPWAAGGAPCRRPRPSQSFRVPSPSSAFTFRTPGFAPGRASLPLYLPAPRRGRGPIVPKGRCLRARRGRLRPPASGRGSVGLGRRRARAALGAGRRHPPPWPQVGGAGRLCSEPGLGPARPSPHAHFPLPACARDGQSFGGLRLGHPQLQPLGWWVGFWDLN